MLKYLKKLFLAPETVPEITLRTNELSAWFTHKCSAVRTDRDNAFTNLLADVTSLTDQLDRLRSIFSQSTLKNPKIAQRERHFYEGNKTLYVKRLETLSRRLREVTHCTLNDFLKQYAEVMKEFTLATTRAYRILQQFVRDDVYRIAEVLKKLDTAIAAFQQNTVYKQALLVDELTSHYTTITGTLEEWRHAQEKLPQLNAEQQELTKKQDTVEKQLRELSSSEAYLSYTKTQEQLNACSQQLEQHERGLQEQFASFARALRKYQRVRPDHAQLVDQYLTDPVAALRADLHFEILDILQGLSKQLLLGSFTVKQHEKILERLAQTTRPVLSAWVARSQALNKQRRDLDHTLHTTTILEEHNTLLRQGKKIDERLTHLAQQITQLEKQIATVSPTALWKPFAQRAGEVFRVSITLQHPAGVSHLHS